MNKPTNALYRPATQLFMLFGGDGDSGSDANPGVSQSQMLNDILDASPMLDQGSLPQGDDEFPSEQLEEGPSSSDQDQDGIPPLEEGGDAGESQQDGEPAEDPTGTQDEQAELSDDDIDLGFQLPVVIDGKSTKITLEELRKGYQTAQHLSNEGRKIGEQRAELEAMRTGKLAEAAQLANVFNELVASNEKAFADDYKKAKEEYETLSKQGDRMSALEAHEKMTRAQTSYWQARNTREGLIEKTTKAITTAQQESQQKAAAEFHANIKTFVPDWSPEVQKANIEFAAGYGVSPEMAMSIMSPQIAKLVNDARVLQERLKKGQTKAQEKPKLTPIKRSPNGGPGSTARNREVAARMASGKANNDEFLEFLSRTSPNIKGLN
jgi:hypothetical protein